MEGGDNPVVMPAIVVRQRKSWRRKNGVFLYFEGENECVGLKGR